MNPTAPSSTTITSAAHVTCTTNGKTARTTASAPSDPYRVGRSARSVSGPAARAPRVMPMPKRARTGVTEDSPKPIAFVVMVERYEYTAKTPAKPKTAVSRPRTT